MPLDTAQIRRHTGICEIWHTDNKSPQEDSHIAVPKLQAQGSHTVSTWDTFFGKSTGYFILSHSIRLLAPAVWSASHGRQHPFNRLRLIRNKQITQSTPEVCIRGPARRTWIALPFKPTRTSSHSSKDQSPLQGSPGSPLWHFRTYAHSHDAF